MGYIKYQQSKVNPNAYRTQTFGNLLSDTIQGMVDKDSDGEWSGWFMNHSDNSKSEFKLGFGSRAAAARWVNKRLRDYGVR